MATNNNHSEFLLSLIKNLALALKVSTCLHIKNGSIWVGSGQYGISGEEVVNNRLQSICKPTAAMFCI